MVSFTDSKGRAWQVAINVITGRRVRDRTGIDVLKFPGDRFQALTDLLGSVRMVDVMFALVEPQAAAQKVTADDFAEATDSDTIARMDAAFVEALAKWLPSKRGQLVREAFAIAAEAEAEALAAFDNINLREIVGEAKEARARIERGARQTTTPIV